MGWTCFIVSLRAILSETFHGFRIYVSCTVVTLTITKREIVSVPATWQLAEFAGGTETPFLYSTVVTSTE